MWKQGCTKLIYAPTMATLHALGGVTLWIEKEKDFERERKWRSIVRKVKRKEEWKNYIHHIAILTLCDHSWEAQRWVSVTLSTCGHTRISGCTKRKAQVPPSCFKLTKVNILPAFSCKSHGCHSWVYRCRDRTERLLARDPSGHYWAAYDRVPESSNSEHDFKHHQKQRQRTWLAVASWYLPSNNRWQCWC